MNLEMIIQQHKQELSLLDKEILEYILAHQDKVGNMSIVELGNEVHTSKSTIMRLTQKIGFSGFSEFKYFIRQNLLASVSVSIQKVDFMELQKSDIKRTIDYLETLDLNDFLKKLDEAETIYCYGTGYSQQKAVEEFGKSMLYFEKKMILLPNKTEFDMAMPMISKQDILICASLSGETEEIKQNLDILSMRHIPILSISGFGDNYFSRVADFSLFYYSTPFIMGGKPCIANSLIGLNILLDYIFRKYGEYI